MFNISFAAFLMGAEQWSYFGAGTHFHADPDWNYDWPALRRPIGAPVGPAVQDGERFTRTFQHLIAEVDCSSQTGTLQWQD